MSFFGKVLALKNVCVHDEGGGKKLEITTHHQERKNPPGDPSQRHQRNKLTGYISRIHCQIQEKVQKEDRSGRRPHPEQKAEGGSHGGESKTGAKARRSARIRLSRQ